MFAPYETSAEMRLSGCQITVLRFSFLQGVA
jgi:hypothetical protein